MATYIRSTTDSTVNGGRTGEDGRGGAAAVLRHWVRTYGRPESAAAGIDGDQIDDCSCTSCCIPFSSKFLKFPTGDVGGGTPNNTYSDNVFHQLTCLFHCCHATIVVSRLLVNVTMKKVRLRWQVRVAWGASVYYLGAGWLEFSVETPLRPAKDWYYIDDWVFDIVLNNIGMSPNTKLRLTLKLINITLSFTERNNDPVHITAIIATYLYDRYTALAPLYECRAYNLRSDPGNQYNIIFIISIGHRYYFQCSFKLSAIHPWQFMKQLIWLVAKLLWPTESRSLLVYIEKGNRLPRLKCIFVSLPLIGTDDQWPFFVDTDRPKILSSSNGL